MIAISASTVTEPQWFIVRGWLDEQEWGNEPPDPDDLWCVGDRVRLKSHDLEGMVVGTEYQEFLNSLYLPYVLVLWDGDCRQKSAVPEQLIRLTRYIPPNLTWRAEQSFTEEKKKPSKTVRVAADTSFEVGDVVAALDYFDKGKILHIHGKKATVEVSGYSYKQQIKLCHLSLVSRETVTVGGHKNSSGGNRAASSKTTVQVQPTGDKNSSGGNRTASLKTTVQVQPTDRKNSSGGKSQSRKESRFQENSYEVCRVADSQIGSVGSVINQKEEIACPSGEELKLEDGGGMFPPEPKKRTASGWLEKYVKTKTLKKTGVKATFPKVEGHRDPDNDSHWYWAYKYEEKSLTARSSNGHITRAVSVPVCKLGIVRRAIADGKPVSLILQFIKN